MRGARRIEILAKHRVDRHLEHAQPWRGPNPRSPSRRFRLREGLPNSRPTDTMSSSQLPDREALHAAIASNESFPGWTKTFTDPRLCAAIVDRLTFNGTIIETGTASYRLAHTRQQQSA